MTALTPPQTGAVHMTASAAGKPVGDARFERTADGSIRATTRIRKLSVVFDGAEKDGVLARYRTVVSDGRQRTIYDYRDGRLTKVWGAKTESYDFALPVNVVSRLVPALDARLLASLNGDGPWRPSAWVIDGNVQSAIDIVALPPGSSEGRPVRRFRVAFEDTVSEIDLDEAGRVVGVDIPNDQRRFVADGWGGLFEGPSSSGPPLSAPTYAVQRIKNIRLRMRDGRILMADAVRPTERGRFPVILLRTSGGRQSAIDQGEFWARRGYAFVAQDRRPSQAEGSREEMDGADTIAGILHQPWCDGHVGMIGSGEDARSAWMAAMSGSLALKAIVPEDTQWGAEDPASIASRASGAVLHLSNAADPLATRPWEILRRLGRTDQWLVLGPSLGQDALNEMRLRFFDTFLKGIERGMDAMPRAQVYVRNADRWLSLDGWPATNSSFETLYLAEGSLVSVVGASGTSAFSPKGSARTKSLLYQAAPVARATTICGPFECRLFFKTNNPQSRLRASLVDIDPKGKIEAIDVPGEGEPDPKNWGLGRIVATLLRPGDAAWELGAGHRLGLLIDGFPVRAASQNERNVILSGAVTPSRITFRKLD